jgi:undecaprenyl phosphate-alpha-L-ara4N flippase subunit ArnE
LFHFNVLLTCPSLATMGLTAALVIVVAIGLEVLGQISFKQGASSINELAGTRNIGEYLYHILGNSWIRVGIIAYVIEILFAVAALTLAPLSVVFPLLSLSYCGVAIAGRLFLGERLAVRNQAAIALITIGAALVSWSIR